MMKKIITVILAVVMCMGMTGCSLFETFSNDDEDTVTSYRDVNSLKNNKAYIWHNDRESDIQKDLENPADYDVFFQCIKGDINFKGEENDDTYGNNRSIWISSENDKDIPTLSSGDMLIYVSDDSVPDTISFERFADYGYSIGISNLTADEGGHYYFPYEESDEDEYKRFIDMKSDAKEITSLDYVSKLYLDKVGEIKVDSESISDGGTVSGLKKDEKYICEFYTGTFYQDFELTADIHTFGSFERFYSHDYVFLHSNCIAISIPDYFVSGYYYVNGVGIFRYVSEKDEKTYNNKPYDENIDWNKPLILYDEDGACTYDPGNPEAYTDTVDNLNDDSDSGKSGYINYDEIADIAPREE